MTCIMRCSTLSLAVILGLLAWSSVHAAPALPASLECKERGAIPSGDAHCVVRRGVVKGSKERLWIANRYPSSFLPFLLMALRLWLPP